MSWVKKTSALEPLREVLDLAQRGEVGGRVVVEAGDQLLLPGLPRVGDVGAGTASARCPSRSSSERVVADRVAGRVAGAGPRRRTRPPRPRANDRPSRGGETPCRRSRAARTAPARGVAKLLLADPGHRVGQVALAAAVIEVEMRVDHRGHIGGREPALLELRRDRLLVGLLGQLERQELLDRLQVVARVEEEEPVGVLDQHAVDREADRVAAVDVPHHVRAVDHQ